MMEQRNKPIKTNAKADCPKCKFCRENNYNFCDKCGKQLKENPVIIQY